MFALETCASSSGGHLEYGAEVLESTKMRNLFHLFKTEFFYACYFIVLRNLFEFFI